MGRDPKGAAIRALPCYGTARREQTERRRAPDDRGCRDDLRVAAAGARRGLPTGGTTLVAELVATCFADIGHDEHELSIFRPAPRTFPVYVSKAYGREADRPAASRRPAAFFVIGVHRDRAPSSPARSPTRASTAFLYDRWSAASSPRARSRTTCVI